MRGFVCPKKYTKTRVMKPQLCCLDQPTLIRQPTSMSKRMLCSTSTLLPQRRRWDLHKGIVTLLSGVSRSRLVCRTGRLNTPAIQRETNHRLPVDLISPAGWLYVRFCLSDRDGEERLWARGVTVADDAIRQWRRQCGPPYAHQLRRRQPSPGDQWPLEEGLHPLQAKRLPLGRGGEHRQPRSLNHRASTSHQPTRPREQRLQRLKAPGQGRRCLSACGPIGHHFRLPRPLCPAPKAVKRGGQASPAASE
jgi:putative transposase